MTGELLGSRVKPENDSEYKPEKEETNAPKDWF